MPGHVANLPPLICNAQRFSGAGRRGVERFRRARSDCGAISRKDSVGSSRRTALPSKPVARNLVAIDCFRCITELRLGNLNVSSGSGAHIHRINKRPFKVVRVEGRLTATLPPDIERKVNDRIGRVTAGLAGFCWNRWPTLGHYGSRVSRVMGGLFGVEYAVHVTAGLPGQFPCRSPVRFHPPSLFARSNKGVTSKQVHQPNGYSPKASS